MWFAAYILEGLPLAVSNFKMECLYLLRGPDGNVMRLVRFMNTKGEVSLGNEIGGADILPNEMYAGAEKFRQLVATKGNFTWGHVGGAGNTELQILQVDVTEEAAYREVKLIEYCGWHELKPNLGLAPVGAVPNLGLAVVPGEDCCTGYGLAQNARLRRAVSC